MDNLAIFIAISSFLFTLYQWLIVMNSRKPNIKLLRLKLGRIFLNKDYNDFVISPALNFIMVNLSEIPNSVVDMKMYCTIGNKWYEGVGKNIDHTFPVMIHGHGSEIVGNRDWTVSFSFPVFPTDEDLKNMKVRIDFCDQYDKVYKIKLSPKDINCAATIRLPQFGEDDEVLGDVRHTEPKDKTPVIHYILYHKKSPKIAIYEYGRNGGCGGISIPPDVMWNNSQSSQEKKVFYYDLGSSEDYSKNVYIHKEDNIPVAIEVELIYGGQPRSTKCKLPKEYIELVKKAANPT